MVDEHHLALIYNNSPVLYQDEYCKLTEDTLVIKKFYFGTLKAKVIRLKEVRVVYFDEQKNNSKYSHRRAWGRGLIPIRKDKTVYWAADFRRCLPGEKHERSDVIVDTEDGVLKGFTVADVQVFLSLLRLYGPISTIIIDNLDIN